MRIVFAVTALGSAGLLGLAAWPGLVEILLFGLPHACVLLPAAGCWSLAVAGAATWDVVGRPEPPDRRRWWGLASAGVVLATLGVLWLHVPQRAAFAFCSADLQAMVDGAPADEFRGVEVNRRVGPYTVDRYATDRRGGVFFRTATGPDGIGPDQMSYGFAFRPNGVGSPFGQSRYRQTRLFGDWYAFSVSDD